MYATQRVDLNRHEHQDHTRRHVKEMTPFEILHSILLGLCVALSSSLDMKFTETFHTSLDCWITRISQMYKHQREKDVLEV